MKGAVIFRGFDGSRIKMIRGPENGEPTVSFWAIPRDSSFVPDQTVKWNFKFAPNQKAFVFHDEMEQICSSLNWAQVLKEFLDENHEARSHIVIFAKSRKMYLRHLRAVKKKLRTISANQLRFFRKQTATEYPWAEYWLVPSRR